MTSRSRRAYYEDFQGRVRGVLAAFEELFPRQQVEVLEQMIDANETGVALDILTAMLTEVHAVVSIDLFVQIDRLVREMELPPEVAARVRPRLVH